MAKKKQSFEEFKQEVKEIAKKKIFLDLNDFTDDDELHKVYQDNESPSDYINRIAIRLDLDIQSDFI